MGQGTIWLFASFGALVVIVTGLVFSIRRSIVSRTARRDWGTNDLQLLGMVLVMAGIVFGDDRGLGYGLIALGVGPSVVGMLRARRSRSHADAP